LNLITNHKLNRAHLLLHADGDLEMFASWLSTGSDGLLTAAGARWCVISATRTPCTLRMTSVETSTSLPAYSCIVAQKMIVFSSFLPKLY